MTKKLWVVCSSQEFELEKSRIGKTKSTEIEDACILGVEVGTNCPQGGDWGYGGRTYLALGNDGGVGWMVKVKDVEGEEHCFDQPIEVEVLLGGDAEYRCLIKALEFALNVLKKGDEE